MFKPKIKTTLKTCFLQRKIHFKRLEQLWLTGILKSISEKQEEKTKCPRYRATGHKTRQAG